MQSFFEFLISVINNHYINGLHLFWDSFLWNCLQISSDAKCYSLSCPRHCHWELIVFIVYNFQIWNKKEHNIIISRVISSDMGPMYIETPYIISCRVISCDMGPLYIETPYIIIFTNPSARAGYDTRSIFLSEVYQHPPLRLSVVAIEREAFWSASTRVADFTYLLVIHSYTWNYLTFLACLQIINI